MRPQMSREETRMKELDGKTAIISGGAEGIGLGIAQVLGRYGMNIVIADINAEQLEKQGRLSSRQALPCWP